MLFIREGESASVAVRDVSIFVKFLDMQAGLEVDPVRVNFFDRFTGMPEIHRVKILFERDLAFFLRFVKCFLQLPGGYDLSQKA